MAKLALKLRDQKRRKTVEKFKARRAQLLEIIYDQRASDEAREEARDKLQRLPRDASPVRLRNRCALTGRPRGVYRKFGLGRNKLRDLALRGARMYEFFDRLVNIAMPRIRDFRGVSNRAFDGRGNYNLGFKEQIIFPEIDYDKIDTLRGMNIAITTTAKTDDEARALLSAFRFPFKH